LRRRLESPAFRPPFRRLDFSPANEQTLTWQSESIFTAISIETFDHQSKFWCILALSRSCETVFLHDTLTFRPCDEL